MSLIPPTVRSLALLTLALAGCEPDPQSLGRDFPEPPASIRWSTDLDVSTVDLAVAPDGSIHIVGLANSVSDEDGIRFQDLGLAKLDPDGAVVWSRLEPIDEDGNESPTAIAVDDAGDVYVAIADYGEDAGGDNRLRRLDADGNERWSVVLPGQPFELVTLPGGGAIVVGRRDAMAWAQRLDADGNLGWSRGFGDPAMSRNELAAIALTPDGGVMLGGLLGAELESGPEHLRSWSWVAAVELADGTERWQRKLSEARTPDDVQHIGVTADGSTLVTRSDYAGVLALAPDGASKWALSIPTPDLTSWLAVYPDGSFAVGGTTIDEYGDCEPLAPCNDQATYLALIERYDADRSLRWSLRDPECEGYARHLAPSADGGLIASIDCFDADDRGIVRLEP